MTEGKEMLFYEVGAKLRQIKALLLTAVSGVRRLAASVCVCVCVCVCVILLQ